MNDHLVVSINFLLHELGGVEHSGVLGGGLVEDGHELIRVLLIQLECDVHQVRCLGVAYSYNCVR